MKTFWHILSRNYFVWLFACFTILPVMAVGMILFGIKDAIVEAVKAFYCELRDVYRDMRDVELSFSRKDFERKKKRFTKST